MLCAARAEVGPLTQSFWAIWDREGRRRHAHTRMLPGSHMVRFDGPELRLDARGAKAALSLGEAAAVEAVCPSGEGGYGWTRKTAGVPIAGTVEAGGRTWEVEARGVVDESAGYHQRHTSWRWSAGVGRAVGGRPVAWNLVTGINDPPQRSERAIWVEGVPTEPAPVSFSGTDAIEFPGGARLAFEPEFERARKDNLLLFRSRYRHLFGTFSGSLDGVELDQAFGVMEEHEAVW